jgi:hypothetical protein
MSAGYEGVVVLGVPRSGTTLLRRLLDAHPEFHCPPETNLLGAASRFLEEHPHAGGLAVGVVPGLAFSGLEEEQVLGRLREFVFGFFRELAQRAGKPRWAEKTATDVFHVDAIERLCGGRCRYLIVTRSPLDAICSMQELSERMQAYLPELHAYVQRHPSTLEAFAHAWVDANQRLLELERRHPDWCLRLRYEDLAADPARAMARVFEFLGAPADPAALIARAMDKTGEAGLGDWRTYERSGIDGASVGRARTLDAWTVRRLLEIVNPLMPALGYEALRAPAAPDPAIARRAYQLGRANARNLKKPDKPKA